MICTQKMYDRFILVLELFPTIQHKRHRPPVYEVDVHHRAEAASFDVRAAGAKLRDELFVEGLGNLWRRGFVERGTPALPAVAVERELRDDQQRASCIGDGEIHLALAVLEYSERQYFLREILRVYIGIVLPGPEEDEHPLPYSADGLAVYIDPGFFYTLDYRAHGFTLHVAAFQDAL